MTQNYLFVDIDGPLLPGKCHMFQDNRAFLHAFNNGVKGQELFGKTPPRFDEWGVRAHNLLAKYGNAKIVIVTNWRRWCSIDQIQDLFAEQGLRFEYADNPSCAMRGMSSERYNDIASHMEDYIEEGARCLVIDDFNLQPLNLFYKLEGEEGERDERAQYYGPTHDDMQVGIVQNKDGTVEHDIRFKWLNVDYNNGLTVEQFKIGANFFQIDWDQLNFQEFGIPIKTVEQKRKEREEMERLYSALIV